MKVLKYYQALIRINNEELPNLPPFGAGQALSQDEMIDILLHGTPCSWQNEMERQGFDPMASTANEVVDFMGRTYLPKKAVNNVGEVEASSTPKGYSNKNPATETPSTRRHQFLLRPKPLTN
jgi:hypothetical protein